MYAEIIVPLAINGTLTYHVPEDEPITPQIGMRALVQIGKKKIYTGIIHKLNENIPDMGYTIKPILSIIDNQPILTSLQLRLWEWIADYYMCSLGEVCKAALPNALKLESESRIWINDDFIAENPLPKNQQIILDALADGKEHTINELSKLTDIKSIVKHINTLAEMEAIYIDECVDDKYQQKIKLYVSLSTEYSSEVALHSLITALKRAPKQLSLLTTYLEETNYKPLEIDRDYLLKKSNSNSTILKQLIDKNILTLTKKDVRRINFSNDNLNTLPILSDAQQQAYHEIKTHFETKLVTLLNGVTSSGKTSIYTHLIDEQIKQGKQVLYLVPEIALTTQLTDRLKAIFGSKLGVYHSKYSDAERAEIYKGVLTDSGYEIIIGVRSAIFLPFSRLGLIIVDEEHDASYKQEDPAPRYNARNSAIMLASFCKAKVLLGSATPSIESYHNTQIGKYGLVNLTTRYKDIQLPQIELVDLKQSYKRKEYIGHFSDVLIAQINQCLSNNKQVLLFQNRRGFAPYISCKQCGFIPKCVNCDVALTMHKRYNKLVCHYCGYSINIPQDCPNCHNKTLTEHGFGTERIEDELIELFPQARIGRMDTDTTHSRKAYEKIINQFSNHELDILVGTQMITKGLHFDDVSLVAVLNADSLMNQPNYRAHEKTFQILEQVSGRAGRKGQQGLVMIQTQQPEELILTQVKNHDFNGFFEQQIEERKLFHYPPFYRIIEVTLKHRDERKLQYITMLLQNRLFAIFGKRISKVIVPVIAWVQNQHIRQIIIKIEAEASYVAAKKILQDNINIIKETPEGKNTIVSIDVDPY